MGFSLKKLIKKSVGLDPRYEEGCQHHEED